MLKTFKNPYEMTYQPTRAKKISHCWYGGPQFDQLHLEHHQHMVETPRDGFSIDPQNSPTHLYLIWAELDLLEKSGKLHAKLRNNSTVLKIFCGHLCRTGAVLNSYTPSPRQFCLPCCDRQWIQVWQLSLSSLGTSWSLKWGWSKLK